MKIIQIVTSGERASYPYRDIYGLGDNGELYRWEQIPTTKKTPIHGWVHMQNGGIDSKDSWSGIVEMDL